MTDAAPPPAPRRWPDTLARWTGATALAGALVGGAEAAGLGGTATLLLPGLAIGLAQRLAAPDRVPAIWTLFSGLAWVAGVLLDATLALRPEGLGLWLIPTATMAAWQTFLLGEARRAWPWLPASLAAAAALQATAQAACAVGCAPLAQGIGPAAATIWTYLAGFAGYGLVTGLALAWIARRGR
jgi:hypothetical protein